MFYLDTQRTATRRDSSLISKKNSLVSITDRDQFLAAIPEAVPEPRARGSVQREITSLFFDSMLKNIIDTWEVLEVKEKKKKAEKVEKVQRMPRKSRLVSYQATQPTSPLDLVWWTTPDEKAVIRFKNGNVYEGNISSKCMHGEGRFQWADGTVYIGQFHDNQIQSRGTIEWKDTTWYTGEFAGNLRHGNGLYVDSRLQRCYSGGWYCGTKHGNGTIYYSPDFQNSYEGEWDQNKMHGVGVRDYSNQSAYSGEFEYSEREGKGEMIFPNHDFYRGQWQKGVINGTGFYIWNCIRNNTMAAPYITSYFGTWFKGLRHGYGLFHLGPGLVSHYKGQVKNNYKHEQGKLVTAKGLIVSDKKLFTEDHFCPEKPSCNIPSHIRIKRNLSLSKKILISDDTQAYRYHIENAVRNHIEHEHHARVSIINDFMENNRIYRSIARSSKIDKLFCEDYIDFEDRSLKLVVIRFEQNINFIYNLYSKICNTKPTFFSCVLIRLYLWQFFYDCNFHEKGLNLTQIDDILFRNKRLTVNDPHDPFERIYRWQFVHSLITLACHFYVGTTIPGPKPDTMVASAFCRFMETDVLPNVGKCKGKLVKHNFVPIQPIYELYLSLEEPRTVRKFLCAARVPIDHYMDPPQPPMINAEEEQITHGKNCYLFGDEMIFVEDKNPVFKQVPKVFKPNNFKLFNFGNLSSKCIIEQFANILPNVMENDKIMDTEILITFYEFFEAFIGCTEESIRVKEEELKWKAYREPSIVGQNIFIMK